MEMKKKQEVLDVPMPHAKVCPAQAGAAPCWGAL